MVIFFTLGFCKTLYKIIANAINWAIIVDRPIPIIPKGGINRKPNISTGFKIIFRRKLKTKTFLYVLVSPSACNKELSDTTRKKRNDP